MQELRSRPTPHVEDLRKWRIEGNWVRLRGVDQRSSSLGAIVEELKLLLVLYDVVIVADDSAPEGTADLVVVDNRGRGRRRRRLVVGGCRAASTTVPSESCEGPELLRFSQRFRRSRRRARIPLRMARKWDMVGSRER